MADIRINALTEASASVTTDFLPIDGGTGTRKLSAFSPSFGGNATVGGTLTVNGTNPSSIPRLSLNSPVSETYNFGAIGTIQSADVSLEATSTAATGLGIGLVVRRTNGGEFARFINGAVTTRLANMSCDAAGTFFSISSAVSMYLDSTKTMLTGGNVLIGGTTDIPGTGGLKVFGTTASTTTSTGALVVGNGTSGGLGVGGAINAGGAISTFTGGVTRTSLNTDGTMFWGVSANLGVLTWDTNKARVGAQSTADFALTTGTSTDRLQISGSTGVITIPGTTASTSTSSGALVVSGGVGVAGAIYAGSNIISSSS